MEAKIGTEVDIEFLKRDLPMHFLELCKYQQDIINKYKEYIEKYLHQPIKESTASRFDPFECQTLVVKHFTIPETRLVAKCSGACASEWDYLKTTTPLVSPDYCISMAYKEYMEKKNAEAD